MTNLNDSWQASVIKLAQTGNSRAIAFWMNRYLVPQGICAQVETEQSGCVVIRVVCRQVPEADRLVRFICHRLCKLNSDAIQQVRITAQVVGSPQILWEKSARLVPPSQRQQKHSAEDISNLQHLPSPELVAAISTVGNTDVQTSSQVGAEVDHQLQEQQQSTTGLQTSSLSKTKSSKAKSSKVKPLQPKARTRSLHSSLPGLQNAGFNFSNWKPAVQQKLKSLQTASLDATDRSVRWFARQKPATRILLLSSSAVTAFLIGCSFELAGYYVSPGTFQQSKTNFAKLLRSTVALSGSVKTSSERIPVIQQPVPNPDDPTISLIFSNSATLTRLPASQLSASQLTALNSSSPASTGSPSPSSPSTTTPVITNIETVRLADMVVTNLTEPLGSTASATAPSSPSSDKTSSSDDKASLSDTGSSNTNQGDDSAPPTSEDKLVLKQLPSLSEDAQTADMSDGETERAKYTAGDEAASNSEQEHDSNQNSSQTQKKNSPLWPQELRANRVDLVNLASDTVMPEGATQLDGTLNLLKQNGIYTVGSGQTLSEARRPQIFNVKGQRIAYLGYSDSSTHAANASMAGINVSLNKQMEEDIKAIRDQVDWIVINFNWNRELRAYPEEWQTSLAHAAIDYGADLVVGYDPSVTQGGEVYKGRAIVYSLGSSVDEYNDKPAGNYNTGALKVTLKQHVMELEFLPIQVKQGIAEVAKGELGKTILNYFEQASSVFDQPLHSPTSINSELRLSLPSAPNSTMPPSDPFIHYPAPSSPAPDSSQ
jgi:hypothetical protein